MYWSGAGWELCVWVNWHLAPYMAFTHPYLVQGTVSTHQEGSVSRRSLLGEMLIPWFLVPQWEWHTRGFE